MFSINKACYIQCKSVLKPDTKQALMQALGYMSSLVMSAVLCGIELYKIGAVLDAESRRSSLYDTCDRLHKLQSVGFKILVLLLIVQVSCMEYESLLVVSMFVHEIRAINSEESSIGALDFFRKKKRLKIEIFCKISMYTFIVYRRFIEMMGKR